MSYEENGKDRNGKSHQGNKLLGIYGQAKYGISAALYVRNKGADAKGRHKAGKSGKGLGNGQRIGSFLRWNIIEDQINQRAVYAAKGDPVQYLVCDKHDFSRGGNGKNHAKLGKSHKNEAFFDHYGKGLSVSIPSPKF